MKEGTYEKHLRSLDSYYCCTDLYCRLRSSPGASTKRQPNGAGCGSERRRHSRRHRYGEKLRDECCTNARDGPFWLLLFSGSTDRRLRRFRGNGRLQESFTERRCSRRGAARSQRLSFGGRWYLRSCPSRCYTVVS